ncbi:MAG: biotin transporter BioY [Oscillospiraceae bacterium]
MSQKTKMLARAALLAALTAVGAFIKIPLGYSSITLQFFFTAMAGCLLGPYWGAASQGVYVLLGLVGLPIFTLGGGFGYVFQPTFGFLLGLIPSALVIGLITRKNRRSLRIILACAAEPGHPLRRGAAVHGADSQCVPGQGLEPGAAAAGRDAPVPPR